MYLNPGLIYLIFSQIIAALIYTFQNALLDCFLFCFLPQSSPQCLISAFMVLHTIAICTTITMLSMPLTCIAFSLSCLSCPLLYWLPLLPYLLKPFTAHFLKRMWMLMLPLHQFPLLLRGWFLTFITLLTWESFYGILSSRTTPR